LVTAAMIPQPSNRFCNASMNW